MKDVKKTFFKNSPTLASTEWKMNKMFVNYARKIGKNLYIRAELILW